MKVLYNVIFLPKEKKINTDSNCKETIKTNPVCETCKSTWTLQNVNASPAPQKVNVIK
jgi:hypothetical protein